MKKKRNKEKIIWTIVICMVILISFLGGYIFGLLSGVETITRTMSILFTGATLDIDVNINETLLVQEMNRTIVPYFKEGFGEK